MPSLLTTSEIDPRGQNGLQELIKDDPERAVDEFVKKTSDEAKEAAEQLSKEAESLRVRLQKVESALGRLQAVMRGIEMQSEGFRPVPMPGRVPGGGPYSTGN